MYIDQSKYESMLKGLSPKILREFKEATPKHITVKEVMSTLSPDEREKFKEYADSLKEIKREMMKMYQEAKNKALKETGGNMMNKTMEEE